MKDDEEDLDCVYRHTKKGMALEDEDIEEDEDHFIEDEEDQKEIINAEYDNAYSEEKQ